MRSKTFISLLFLALSLSVAAQEWNTSLDSAKKLATEQDKNIILVFSGSDWCAPCIKLDKNIWQSEAFKAEAAKEWVMVKADFPKKKGNRQSEELRSANAVLSEKYNKEGAFPLVVVMDKNGKVLGKTGFKNVSPEEYIKLLHSFEKK